MSKSSQFVKRHIVAAGKHTTISMEQLYWSAVDHFAKLRGVSPDKFLMGILAQQPQDYSSRAGWIRFWVTAHLFLALKRKPQDVAK